MSGERPRGAPTVRPAGLLHNVLRFFIAPPAEEPGAQGKPPPEPRPAPPVPGDAGGSAAESPAVSPDHVLTVPVDWCRPAGPAPPAPRPPARRPPAARPPATGFVVAGGRAGARHGAAERRVDPRARAVEPDPGLRLRPVIGVVGLGPGTGASTLARALAAELAAHDPLGAAVVASQAGSAAGLRVRFGARGPARRLARAVADALPVSARALGSLCLVEGGSPDALSGVVRPLAPLVLELPARALRAAPAERIVLVAGVDAEPALVSAAAASLCRNGQPAVAVARRGAATRRAGDGPVVALPEARAAAELAWRGLRAPGSLGAAVSELAAALRDGAGW